MRTDASMELHQNRGMSKGNEPDSINILYYIIFLIYKSNVLGIKENNKKMRAKDIL